MERAVGTNIHPGVILKEDLIESAGLSISRAAELLAVPEETLTEIVNGNEAITLDLASRVEAVFGGRADFWLRMQSGYDRTKIEDKL